VILKFVYIHAKITIMKSRIPYLTFATAAILFCLATIAGCKKEGEDLTTNAVGRYLRGAGPAAIEITVARVNNNTVSVNVLSPSLAITHGISTMTSATTITLNDATGIDNTKNERYEATGTGTLNGDSLLISRHEKVFDRTTDVLKAEYDTVYVTKRHP
jgi:hypothetical protein